MDNDYLRDLLLDYESNENGRVILPPYLDGSNQKEIHHVELLCDEGLMIKASNAAYRLTSNGYGFVSAIRDDRTWYRIKAKAGDPTTLNNLMGIALEHQNKVGEVMGNNEAYNLIMIGGIWRWNEQNVASIECSRFLELPYTTQEMIDRFPDDTQAGLNEFKRYPCLFMNEGTENQLAQAGEITKISHNDGDMISFEYVLYNWIEPVPNHSVLKKMNAFGIQVEREFHRKHWALKKGNLFQSLLSLYPVRKGPQVFQIDPYPQIDQWWVSVMMPFDDKFNQVNSTIKKAAEAVNLKADRVDDIWKKDAIIQDIVNLIDQSSIVVCDCTGKKPNVFYELGIAHTLGREFILITQNENDIPFDLKHLRYIKYLDNGEGREKLCVELQERFKTLKSRH